MAHVGKERRFKAVRLLGITPGLIEGQFLFLAFGKYRRRTYQSKRAAVIGTLIHRCVHIYPFITGHLVRRIYKPEFSSQPVGLSAKHIIIQPEDIFPVGGLYLIHIMLKAFPVAICLVFPVYYYMPGVIMQHLAFYVVFPRNDIRYFERKGKFMVGRAQFVPGATQFGNVVEKHVLYVILLFRHHYGMIVFVGMLMIVFHGKRGALFYLIGKHCQAIAKTALQFGPFFAYHVRSGRQLRHEIGVKQFIYIHYDGILKFSGSIENEFLPHTNHRHHVESFPILRSAGVVYYLGPLFYQIHAYYGQKHGHYQEYGSYRPRHIGRL